MIKPVRIAFFGLPIGALGLLRDGHDLGIAVLSPVAGPGRRRLRRALGPARVLGPDSDSAIEASLQACRPDLLVSWFWTRKLPRSWLAMARLGGINAHPSLLPRHRGPDPYFWAIDAGDSVSGVTIHRMGSEYDSGDVLLQEPLLIGNRDAWQLARALDRPALRLLREAVKLHGGDLSPPGLPQDDALATQAPVPGGELLRVDWGWPSARVLRRIRALSPTPGLALELSGLRFFVTRAEPAPDLGPPLEPGEARVGSSVAIRTADSGIAITRAVIGADAELEEGLEVEGPKLAQWVAERLARRADA